MTNNNAPKLNLHLINVSFAMIYVLMWVRNLCICIELYTEDVFIIYFGQRYSTLLKQLAIILIPDEVWIWNLDIKRKDASQRFLNIIQTYEMVIERHMLGITRRDKKQNTLVVLIFERFYFS